MRRGWVTDAPFRHRRKSGEIVPVRVSAHWSRLHGRQAALVVVRRDRREGAAALLERHPHPVILYDAATLRIVDANPAASRLYGWPRAALRAMEITAFRPPESRDALRRDIRAARASETLCDRPSTHVDRAGRRFPVEVTAHWTRVDGRRAALLVVRPRAGLVAAADGGPCSLTPREREVLGLIVDDLSNKEIAKRLRISVRTVESHRDRLMRKTGARTGAGLARWALSRGIEPRA